MRRLIDLRHQNWAELITYAPKSQQNYIKNRIVLAATWRDRHDGVFVLCRRLAFDVGVCNCNIEYTIEWDSVAI